MVGKLVKFNAEARKAIKEGIDIVANAVKSTLGPKGNCVVISDYSNGKPHVTKDGVTVAKEISFTNPWQNVGAELIKEAALSTVAKVGDSTTTSTVLAQALIDGVSQELDASTTPIAGQQLKKEILEVATLVDNYIKDNATPIVDDDYAKIATISANNDPVIGGLIADAFKQVGKDGVIVVEESKSIDDSVVTIKGMQFDKGYVAPHFVTDTTKDTCVLDNPYILIAEHKYLRATDLSQIITPIAKENRSILIIAQQFDDSVIELMKLNKMKGTLKVCLVECPSWGEYRKAFLQDIAIVTGATVITYDSGRELIDATIADLGQCDKIIISKDSTTIVGGIGTEEEITARVEKLRREKEEVEKTPGLDGSFMLDFIDRRIAKMISGCCTLYVGGTTELERGERKDRFDDAVCATKAAIQEGVTVGGGITFLNAINAIQWPDTTGSRIVTEALWAPLLTIMKNAGVDTTTVDWSQFGGEKGYNANTGEVCNLKEAGVIDPAKAVRLAFTNAVSVATLFATTNSVVVPEVMDHLVTI